jgi:hypothetical protein
MRLAVNIEQTLLCSAFLGGYFSPLSLLFALALAHFYLVRVRCDPRLRGRNAVRPVPGRFQSHRRAHRM